MSTPWSRAAADRPNTVVAMPKQRPQPQPALQLTLAQVEPHPADYRRANALLNHPHGCRCSTCTLAARLGHVVRRQEHKGDSP